MKNNDLKKLIEALRDSFKELTPIQSSAFKQLLAFSEVYEVNQDLLQKAMEQFKQNEKEAS